MQCEIPTRSVKLFVKIIQCLSKIGDFANFEGLHDKIILRTISMSHSAFVSFTLDKSFYREYKLLGDNEIGSLRVPLKPCLAVFKTLNNIEKCIMSVDLTEAKLIFEISCKLGIRRVYKLFLEDTAVLQAVYNKVFPNKISFKAGAVLESLQNNFQANLEEITMKISKDNVKICSYIDEKRSNANKLLRTEVTLAKQEFLEYNVHNTADLTFCLKETKAILHFCETAGQPVSICYEKAGKPILLVLRYFSLIEADFVLATLIDPTDDMAAASSQNSAPSTPFDSSPASSAFTSSVPTSSMPSSGKYPKEEPSYSLGIPSSLADISKAEPMDMMSSGHVSGSDDESMALNKIHIPNKTRKRPVFTSDFQSLNEESDDMED